MTEAPMNESGLKPCAHCGSTEVSLSYATNLENVISHRFVECEECGACGPTDPSEKKAITAWNTRTPAGEGGAASPAAKGEGPKPMTNDWQPISTKPDRPMGVLMYFPAGEIPELQTGHDWSIQCGAWTGRWFIHQGTGHDVAEDPTRKDKWPTHWQPLPEPPQ